MAIMFHCLRRNSRSASELHQRAEINLILPVGLVKAIHKTTEFDIQERLYYTINGLRLIVRQTEFTRGQSLNGRVFEKPAGHEAKSFIREMRP